MKKNHNTRAHLNACLLAVSLLSACSQKARDQAIKADLTTKAKEDVNFAGARFSVEKGTVTLTGSCPSVKSKNLLMQKIKTIHIIDSIDDRLVIRPVTIGPSFSLSQQVDSILAAYPSVIATVSDTTVVLTGKVPATALEKMVSAVGKVYPNVNTEQLIPEVK
ncbi:hypothetical protein QF042_003517 [Pedobacter sp. W3I1]|uniref:BON domain-containing protein n=1 Tax=Pedobacter sp. W3I1 TaxID=3042291 RepID=UPI0027852601|nr:BON domain-containing protein [Pedobacter sp. W3I1]MDQ0639952.1 hypothetical protein [Pedobacter sp. W3I1]